MEENNDFDFAFTLARFRERARVRVISCKGAKHVLSEAEEGVKIEG